MVEPIFHLQDLIRFFTDPNRKNLAMKHADGFWYVQSLPGVENRTRVWLTANLIVTSLVPNLIVDYAASRALPRATNWLQPYFQGKPLSDSFTC